MNGSGEESAVQHSSYSGVKYQFRIQFLCCVAQSSPVQLLIESGKVLKQVSASEYVVEDATLCR